jgi:hypothetical protein
MIVIGYLNSWRIPSLFSEYQGSFLMVHWFPSGCPGESNGAGEAAARGESAAEGSDGKAETVRR